MNKILIWLGLGACGIAVGAGATIGAVLPQALKAKHGLEAFVPLGGGRNSLFGKEKVNIVAIGDSETAGYNGLMGRDYRSYSDFLAASFKNANHLGEYHNFANSGERLSDIKRTLFEDGQKVRQLHKADLITLSIGANDILAYTHFLEVPYYQALNLIDNHNNPITSLAEIDLSEPEVSDSNHNKIGHINILDDSIISSDLALPNGQIWKNSILTNHPEASLAFDERVAIFNNAPGLNFSKSESQSMFTKSLQDLKLLFNGENQNLINIDLDWWPKIFDLVQREMATLVRDLHEAAPQAQIQILGHAFPFEQFDKSSYDDPKVELESTSIKQNFERLLSAMRDGAFTSIGTNDFVNFDKINDIVEFDNNVKITNFASENDFIESFKNNTMPNIADIHPSMYGHEIIGKFLFDRYGQENGLNQAKINHSTQLSFPFGTKDDPNTLYNEELWTRNDEDPAAISAFMAQASAFKTLTNISQSLTNGTTNDMINTLINYIFTKAQEDSNRNFTPGDMLKELFTKMPSIKVMVKDQLSQTIGTLSPGQISMFSRISNNIDISDINTVLSTKDNLNSLMRGLRVAATPSIFMPTPAVPKSIGDLTSLIWNISDLIKISRIANHELAIGATDQNISNYNQYRKAQWALTSIFEKINQIQGKIPSLTTLMGNSI